MVFFSILFFFCNFLSFDLDFLLLLEVRLVLFLLEFVESGLFILIFVLSLCVSFKVLFFLFFKVLICFSNVIISDLLFEFVIFFDLFVGVSCINSKIMF